MSFEMSYSMLILWQEFSNIPSQMLKIFKAASYFHNLTLVLDWLQGFNVCLYLPESTLPGSQLLPR